MPLPATRPTHRRPPQPRFSSRPRSPPSHKPVVAGKPLRTEKLVLLPSAPQTKPLPTHEDVLGYDTDAGPVREHKSTAERMSKDQREQAGYSRITAYCLAQGIKMKLLASFLKREHNVQPRVFDEAMYVMYHLPLLPGYSPSTTVRSSAAFSKAHLTRLSEAEENGYQGSYFATPRPRSREDVSRQEDDGYVTEGRGGGYLTEGSPIDSRIQTDPSFSLEADAAGEAEADTMGETDLPAQPTSPQPDSEEPIAEVVFFAYGVAVFYGFNEAQERSIIDDLANAGIFSRAIKEADWEVEEFHFAIDSSIAHPRIYNDFFTFKSPSHLLKLSIAHALAQSTLLATYETTASRVLSDPLALSIPRQLAESGALSLRRRDALRLTGRLFKLRRDVNLVSNVLDVPELFWTEASLGRLYESVREYMEVEGRVRALNEKLLVASDFLDVIHDHLNNSAMERITWIVIWLIILVIFVDMGEVFARYVVHMPPSADSPGVGYAVVTSLMPRGGLVKVLIRVLDGLKQIK